MQSLLSYCLLFCIINGYAFTCFGQGNSPQNVSFRVGAGNSISIKQFTKEETSYNIPGSSFVNVQLSSNLIQRKDASLFLGLEMQVLNYFPVFNEKANLTYLSLLAGRTSRIDVNQALRLKYTGGLSVGTLADVSSSASGYDTYSGNPAKNMNLGLFNNLQVLFGRETAAKWLDYGLSFDVVINGLAMYTNQSYPSYLRQNAFIQYGLSFNINYNFKKHSPNP